jgi:hypothetical protein
MREPRVARLIPRVESQTQSCAECTVRWFGLVGLPRIDVANAPVAGVAVYGGITSPRHASCGDFARADSLLGVTAAAGDPRIPVGLGDTESICIMLIATPPAATGLRADSVVLGDVQPSRDRRQPRQTEARFILSPG